MSFISGSILGLILVALLSGCSPSANTSTIGANTVPVLQCEEDQVIGFDQTTPVPHAIGCIYP